MPLLPSSKTKIALDILLLFFMIFNVLWIPIEISFDIKVSDLPDAFQVFHGYIIIFWYFIEIVLIKTNTAVYNDGKLVVDRYQVIYIYLKGNFM